MLDRQRNNPRRPYIAMALLAAAVVTSMLIVNLSTVSAALAPYFTREQARLTELYFTNYNSMPKFLDTSKSYPFAFTILNHEKQNHTYSYRVTASEGSRATTLAAGEIFLAAGEQAQKQVTFTPTKPGATVKIVIELLDKNQRITFSGQNNFS